MATYTKSGSGIWGAANAGTFPGLFIFQGDFTNLSSITSVWNHLDDTNTASPQPPHLVTDPSTGSGKVLALITYTDDIATSQATRTDVYMNSNTTYIHEGMDQWVRVEFMYPSTYAVAANVPAYRPTWGNWNWTVQFHYGSVVANHGGEGVSGSQPLATGVLTSNTAPASNSTCGSNTSTGSNPMVFAEGGGGDIDLVDGTLRNWQWCEKQPLQYDHWYQLLVHVIWSVDPSLGYFGCWLDGVQYLDAHQSSLFYRSTTGEVDVPNYECSNYRWRGNSGSANEVTWDSTIFYRKYRSATTRAKAES